MRRIDSSFAEWLQSEMDERGLSQSALARLAKVSTTAINNVLKQTRTAGPDICTAIAHAFKLSPEQVFIRAGLLPNEPGRSQSADEAAYLVDHLPEDQQLMALAILHFLVDNYGKK